MITSRKFELDQLPHRLDGINHRADSRLADGFHSNLPSPVGRSTELQHTAVEDKVGGDICGTISGPK